MYLLFDRRENTNLGEYESLESIHRHIAAVISLFDGVFVRNRYYVTTKPSRSNKAPQYFDSDELNMSALQYVDAHVLEYRRLFKQGF